MKAARLSWPRSIRRNLENIPEAFPLVLNLKNPDYVKLVFENETQIAKRFSQIDVTQIRSMEANHYQSKINKNSQKNKKLLRQPTFLKQLNAAFFTVVT